MQTWFESKVKYMKVSESGNEQMVTENFLLDAVSYTDAETRSPRTDYQVNFVHSGTHYVWVRRVLK